ncbi:MAG: multiheme c-type cytochrome [Nitrospirota bacterium]
MRLIILILIVIFTVSFTDASEQEGEDLFKSKCGKCHSLQRALTETKGLEGWKRTSRRMVRYSRGTILKAEADMIAEYLAAREEQKETVASVGAEKEETEMLPEHGVFEFKRVQVDQFIEPSVCGECHSEIYKQWSGSMHSKAYTDPLWRAATKYFVKQVTEKDELLEMRACVKCHTPLGFRSYLITSPEDDYDKLAELPAQGIFCNWCHNINEVKHIGDAGYEVAPGGGEDEPSTMLGPFKDSNSDFHPTKYSELHTRSEFCGLCHNVTHAANNLPLEATYDEWKNSPYNTGNSETTVHCQDCHMRQRPGIPATGKTARPDNPGKAADNGPDREHIWTHYFVGGNTLITKLLGSEVNSRMAEERLKNAADMEILRDGSYRTGNVSSIRVKVTNSGAGHYLPTGLTEVRQMWLQVTITDAEGRVILSSGELDQKGNIDKDAVIYYTQLGNKDGAPVINVAKADRILYDYRIPPKGYTIEKYAFSIPPEAVSPLKVEATLKYRSASQSLARTLLGSSAPEIPVIEMTNAVERIEF